MSEAKMKMSNELRETMPSPNLVYRDMLIARAVSRIDLRDKSVLEIGVGAGKNLLQLSDIPGVRLLGVDFDERAIELARARPQFEKARAVFRRCDFRDIEERVDFVMMFDVLEHIEDDREAIQFIYQTLTPEGAVLLTIPSNSALYGKRDVYHGHFRRYDRAGLRRLLESVGFRVEFMWSWGLTLLARLNRSLSNFGKIPEAPNRDFLVEQSKHSAYSAPPSMLIRLLSPIYTRFPFLLRFQDPFLSTPFMNCHTLVMASKRHTGD